MDPCASDTGCPFCLRLAADSVTTLRTAATFPDGFPVAAGHALVVPRRHVADFFDLLASEQADAWSLVALVRDELASSTGATDFTVGLNAGVAAGQTVGHAHIHVIPRTAGDVPDPRGGVRWVLPHKAAYWDR